VYAGAAREAVFSVPAVIRRINADFVPLALRAPLVNGPDAVRDEDEKWLYQRISRARLAPQGICLLDSRGRVLTWVQMFDSNRSVLAFLDHGLKRFRDSADVKGVVVTERYMRFPGIRSRDVRDETALPAIPAAHPKGRTCSAREGKGVLPPGSLLARLVGRALDERGNPVAGVVKQEDYVEDQFGISPAVQQALAKALAKPAAGRVRLPDDFARSCAAHAHLGHIDVQPCLCMIKGRAENKGQWKRCELWARKLEAGKAATLWRIEGESHVVSELSINGTGVHEVKLVWEGFLAVKGDRLARLLLSARGTEKLQFGNDDHPLLREKGDEVSILPAGRPIDRESGVRYGIIGEPVAAAQRPQGTLGADQPPGSSEPESPAIPKEARNGILNVLGIPGVMFHDRAQKELDLSGDQKKKLERWLQETVQQSMKVFETIKDLTPQERQKEHHALQQKVRQKRAAFLKKTLKEAQARRLRQLELQQEGLFALFARPELQADLKISDEQRKRFQPVMEQMHQQIEPLVKKAHADGNPEGIAPKIMKIRKEHERKIEAILTGAQKKQWQDLLGKPLVLGH
jgi:hypothetical protein